MSTKSAAAQPEVEEKTGDGTSAHTPVDPKVTHLTEAERVGRGKAAREQAPRAEPFDTRAVERSRPGRNSRCRYPRACSRARAHSLRPNAGIAVHVLPRCSEPHGARPCGNAANRPQGTALRRRPPLQFRGLCVTVPGSRLRSQRFRRDASRTVRVGRQAVGRKLRDCRQGSRLRRPRTAIRRFDRRPCISRGDARVRGDEQPRRLVLEAGCDRHGGESSRPEGQETGQGARARSREGANEGQHEGVRQVDARGRRRATHHFRSPADRADRGARGGSGLGSR